MVPGLLTPGAVYDTGHIAQCSVFSWLPNTTLAGPSRRSSTCGQVAEKRDVKKLVGLEGGAKMAA